MRRIQATLPTLRCKLQVLRVCPELRASLGLWVNAAPVHRIARAPTPTPKLCGSADILDLLHLISVVEPQHGSLGGADSRRRDWLDLTLGCKQRMAYSFTSSRVGLVTMQPSTAWWNASPLRSAGMTRNQPSLEDLRLRRECCLRTAMLYKIAGGCARSLAATTAMDSDVLTIEIGRRAPSARRNRFAYPRDAAHHSASWIAQLHHSI